MRERGEEAAPFLSEAMAQIVSELIYTVTGYMNVYANRRDFASCEAVLRFGLDCFSGLRKGNRPNYQGKISCALLTCLAWSQCMTGQQTEALTSLKKAKKLAEFFDSAPSYDENLLRRCTGIFTLKKGKLSEQGTFNELMDKKGYFYSLFTVSQK